MGARWASGTLQVVGRLLLCANYCERTNIAALQPFGLSLGDFDVLNTLRRRGDQHGTKPSDLARSSLITTGAMTARVDRLERAGLIQRTPDPTDRRSMLVQLTGQGDKLAKQALHAVIASNETFLEPLDKQQRHTVASALKLLLLRHGPG